MNTNLNVLVLDDDAVVGRSFDRVLSAKGCDVSTALNGEEALNTIENTKFDVGFYQFAKLAHEALAKRHPLTAGKLKKAVVFAKNVGLFFAAPFVALGYIIALPFVGFYMFAKLAHEAYATRLP